MREILSLIFMGIAVLSMILAQASGVGYTLYLWSTSTTLAVAAWAGFKIWAYLLAVSLISAIFTLILEDD